MNLTYVACIAVSFYGFLLFVWWWRKVGKPSDVFVCVTMWFATNGISDTISLYGSIVRTKDMSAFIDLVSSDLWYIRRIPELVILTVLVVRMTMRVVENNSTKGAKL
jgi:hypothetical protein